MKECAEIVFWLCVATIAYVYFGYPALLSLGILGPRRDIIKSSRLPTISVIVPARNEEKTIVEKLKNLVSLDYPPDHIEILVGNDASTDQTASLVRKFANPAVRLLDFPLRQGKSAVQNALVAQSRGEVLAFTDADCLLPAESLSRLSESLGDPGVGLVTNCVMFTNQQVSAVAENEGLYWRYEKWLRLQESDRSMLAMASGSLFVMRRSLWRPLAHDLGDDFILPLEVIRAGFRNVLETRVAACTPLGQSDPRSMLQMKMRIISKDFRGLLRYRNCLNPLRSGRIALALFSHKLLRWGVPYFMFGAFVTNLLLLSRPVYFALFWLQGAFYLLAVVGFMLQSRKVRSPLSILSSLCLVNLAALLGTLSCLFRRQAGQWETVR
ncbi:MAG TPA: glycosyltransferase [Verrucomicrobiae bacterium]|nr:glycosyltransferase [Verrucomicrobiae bacterium]